MHMIEVSYSWRAEKWNDCDESFLFMTRCRVHVGKDHLTLAPFIPRMARLDVCTYIRILIQQEWLFMLLQSPLEEE